MKILFKLFVVLLVFSTCKEIPSFIDDNIYDPESKNYVLPSPSNFRLEINQDGVRLFWDTVPVEYATTGYILYRSQADTLHYKKIETLPNKGNDFYDYSNNPINVYYKVQSYYLQSSDTIFSSPVYTSLNQNITRFKQASYIKDKEVRFYIDHNFTALNEITIEQKIGSGEYIFLANLKARPRSGISYIYPELPTEEIAYRAFAQNDAERTEYFICNTYKNFESIPKPKEGYEIYDSVNIKPAYTYLRDNDTTHHGIGLKDSLNR